MRDSFSHCSERYRENRRRGRESEPEHEQDDARINKILSAEGVEPEKSQAEKGEDDAEGKHRQDHAVRIGIELTHESAAAFGGEEIRQFSGGLEFGQ